MRRKISSQDPGTKEAEAEAGEQEEADDGGGDDDDDDDDDDGSADDDAASAAGARPRLRSLPSKRHIMYRSMKEER